MTAKEYLNQIREKDAAINRMIRQKENLKGMLYTIGSPGTGEKVQISKSGSSFSVQHIFHIKQRYVHHPVTH